MTIIGSKLQFARRCDSCSTFINCLVEDLNKPQFVCSPCNNGVSPNTNCAVQTKFDFDGMDLDFEVLPDTVRNLDAITLDPKKIELAAPGNIYISGTKDELIDISRTIGVALATGKAEADLDANGRKIIVKVLK